MSSVGWATVLRPGPISEAHSGSSKPTKPRSAPNCQPSRAIACATRSVTTALPATTAARRPRLARLRSAASASSSACCSPSTLSNTSPAMRGPFAVTQAPKAAVRSRRELTPASGSVT